LPKRGFRKPLKLVSMKIFHRDSTDDDDDDDDDDDLTTSDGEFTKKAGRSTFYDPDTTRDRFYKIPFRPKSSRTNV
jgi:hypothetical protein